MCAESQEVGRFCRESAECKEVENCSMTAWYMHSCTHTNVQIITALLTLHTYANSWRHCLTWEFNERVGFGNQGLKWYITGHSSHLSWWRQRSAGSMNGSRGGDVPTGGDVTRACYGDGCLLLPNISPFLFSSLSPCDILLPSSSCFFPPFVALCSFPLLPLLFVPWISYYSVNTCKHPGTLRRFKLVPLSSPRTKLSFVYSLPIYFGLLYLFLLHCFKLCTEEFQVFI